jgi:predicted flap endonuclease-1-like 5' DNA nuclease
MIMTRILGAFMGLVLAVASVFLLAWLLWWLWTRHEKEKETPFIEIEVEPPPTSAEPPAAVASESAATVAEEAAEAPAAPDDLKRIEGIGPKLSSVLQEAGVTTFAQLAEMKVGRIEQILEEADPRLLRLADPSSWPEQAALAAAGEWDAMEALQNQLKRGRRA